MTETNLNRVTLDLPGAKPRVEIDGVLGIVPKIYVDGQRVRATQGGWAIDLKGGERALLRMKGFLPGFQTFIWQGQPVYKLGAHVQLPEKIVMFFPAVLAVLVWFLTPAALALFLMNITIVKNVHMPRGLRIALPIINTIAVYVGLTALLVALAPAS